MIEATNRSSALAQPGTRLRRGARTVAWRGGEALSRAALLGDARALAARLPQRAFVLNACADRYNFLVSFLATTLREQVTLLCGDRSRGALAAVAKRYPGLYALTDTDMRRAGLRAVESVAVDARGDQPTSDWEEVTIPAERVTAIVFTSGTTGTPIPHHKRWDTLRGNAALCAQYMGIRALGRGATPSVVATVPPQHMYGLETSVLTVLHEGAAVHAGQPFLPAEIAAALLSVPAPRFLVTTPYHLRALVRARPILPPLTAVVSATASLTASLAGRAEEMFSTRVVEIYGFTEAGSVATRRTVEADTWRCQQGIRLDRDRGRWVVRANHLDGPVLVPDVVRLISRQSFVLEGRGGDLVDVAGKRASLAGLNTILSEVDGVVDGTFFQPRRHEVEGVSRLVAIVVAPKTSARDIREALREQIDSAFLPRRIFHVDQLPRSATGKLSHQALGDLARKMGVEEPC